MNKTKKILVAGLVLFVLATSVYVYLNRGEPPVPEETQEPEEEHGDDNPGEQSGGVINTNEKSYEDWVDLEPYPKEETMFLEEGRYSVIFKSDIEGIMFKVYKTERPGWYKVKEPTDGESGFDVNNGESGDYSFVFGEEGDSTGATKGYLEVTKVGDFE